MKTFNNKKVIENPFYGKVELKNLWLEGGKGNVSKSVLMNLLDRAWVEAKEILQLRQLFFVIIFAYGDITNRHHNILRGTKQLDNGGEAWREGFIWSLEWMRKNTPKQYYIFLFKDLIRQFTGLLSILISRVKTQKGKTNITEVINTLIQHDMDKLAEYLANIIRGTNPADKVLIAKALVRPRLSKRQKRNRDGEKVGSRNLQSQTISNMKSRELLYQKLSDIMGWVYIQHKHNFEFTGLNDWRKEYNGDLESVLFSSGKIVEFDHDQFFLWLNQLPASARFRVRRRLLDGDALPKGKWISKYGNVDFGIWFIEWETVKEEKQEEKRILEQKVKSGEATEDDVIKLEKVKKEAKVTTGAINLKEILEKLLKGGITTKEANLTFDSILDATIFEVPVLVIGDDSGSMGGMPIFIARLLTTLAMLKNPSEELSNYFVTFGSDAQFYYDGSQGVDKANRYMSGQSVTINKLVDKTKDFMTNYSNISKILTARSGGTNFSSVASAFKRWLDDSRDESEKEIKKENIRQYPVFLVISDGHFNSHHNEKTSLLAFKQNMLQWFGWDGVVVIWDVVPFGEGGQSDRFDDVDNVFHYAGWNPGIINTMFSKLHDLDIIDTFIGLKTIMESNRYQIIQHNTI